MATADRMFYAGLDLPFSDEFSTKVVYNTVPRTDKVCFALGRRHEYNAGFPHKVSATYLMYAAWLAHVSNAEVLQQSGLSTIGDILRHRRLSLF